MRKAGIILVLLLLVLSAAALPGAGAAGADPFTDSGALFDAVKEYIPGLTDVKQAKTAENAAVALYVRENRYGLEVLEYDPEAGFFTAARNDRMLPLTDDSMALLDDHAEEIAVHWERAGYAETEYLELGRNGGGAWLIREMDYSRTDESGITGFTCRLSEDGKTLEIREVYDPRIEWPADTDFTLEGFDRAAAHAVCERAAAVLNAAALSGRTEDGKGWRIIWDATEQYEPEIPEGFDCRMSDDMTRMSLFRFGPDGRTQEEWIFEWHGTWQLTAVRSTEPAYAAYPDGTLTRTESLTEITENAVWSRKWLKDGETGEILYTYRDVTYPNVLDSEALFLAEIRFDAPPVSAGGYSWSSSYGSYRDETLLPELFGVFFPDHTYVDGCLMEDGTLEFIGRKADGTLALLCGENAEGDRWEWAESTPLPEGAKFGYENFSDSVCLDAGNGRTAAHVRRVERGTWAVDYVNGLDFCTGPDWVGMYSAEDALFGTHPWGDITAIDWRTLPADEYRPRETKEEKAARLSGCTDRTDWAAPARDDPEALTELLVEAGNEKSLLGRFMNGTPLYVLQRGEEWTKVRIGHGSVGTMTGWMRTEYLAFGDDTLKVNRDAMRRACEQQLVHPASAVAGSRKGRTDTLSGWLVIGRAETDSRYVIVYDLRDGDVGMIPEEDLYGGNG